MKLKEIKIGVYHLNTQEKFNAFLEQAEKQGLKWASDSNPNLHRSYWRDYREETCVQFNERGSINYANTTWFKGENFTIIPFEDLLEEEKIMKKLEVSIERKRNVVVVEILHQDESLRSKDVLAHTKDNTYEIASIGCIEIASQALWVRGEARDRDDILGAYAFDNELDAINWCNAMNQMIDTINKDNIETTNGWVKER